MNELNWTVIIKVSYNDSNCVHFYHIFRFLPCLLIFIMASSTLLDMKGFRCKCHSRLFGTGLCLGKVQIMVILKTYEYLLQIYENKSNSNIILTKCVITLGTMRLPKCGKFPFFYFVLSVSTWVTVFSAVRNNKHLMANNGGHLTFLHGLKAILAYWIILGHCYLLIDPYSICKLVINTAICSPRK